MTRSTCRSCGAPVRWTRTTEGKMMPVDPDPVEGGNLAMTGGTTTTRAGSPCPVVRVVDPDHPTLLDPGDRFVSHFATCPDADEWRRR